MNRVATVHVFYSDDAGDQTAMEPMGDGSFRIILSPKQMVRNGITSSVGITQLKTALAHELGHFVEHISNGVEHSPLYVASNGPMDREKKAWAVARQMTPELDRGLMYRALKSYEKDYPEFLPARGSWPFGPGFEFDPMEGFRRKEEGEVKK